MKLRNKKTGEIVEGYKGEPIDLFIYLGTDGEGDELNRKTYHSLAELNEEWEDYESNKPLIKDEKIRRAVRAWAEANAINNCKYDGNGHFATRWNSIRLDGSQINLDRGRYAVDELCGEGGE